MNNVDTILCILDVAEIIVGMRLAKAVSVLKSSRLPTSYIQVIRRGYNSSATKVVHMLSENLEIVRGPSVCMWTGWGKRYEARIGRHGIGGRYALGYDGDEFITRFGYSYGGEAIGPQFRHDEATVYHNRGIAGISSRGYLQLDRPSYLLS